MTEMHAYNVITVDGVIDQVVARNKSDAVSIWRDRWDDADGPVPDAFRVERASE